MLAVSKVEVSVRLLQEVQKVAICDAEPHLTIIEVGVVIIIS